MMTEQALITARLGRRLQKTEDLQRDYEQRLRSLMQEHQWKLQDLRQDFAQETNIAQLLYQAYQKGVEASVDLRPIEENPYPEGNTNYRAEWEQGWTDADKERKDP